MGGSGSVVWQYLIAPMTGMRGLVLVGTPCLRVRRHPRPRPRRRRRLARPRRRRFSGAAVATAEVTAGIRAGDHGRRRRIALAWARARGRSPSPPPATSNRTRRLTGRRPPPLSRSRSFRRRGSPRAVEVKASPPAAASPAPCPSRPSACSPWRVRGQHVPRAADAARRGGHRRVRQPALRARRRAGREPHDHGRRRDPQPLSPVRPHQRVQPGDGRALRALGRRRSARSYGDRLSSLLVVENRDGDDDARFAGSSALSITDANVIFEGKLPGDATGSWLVTGRRTYYDLVAERSWTPTCPPSRPPGPDVWEPRPGQRLIAVRPAQPRGDRRHFDGRPRRRAGRLRRPPPATTGVAALRRARSARAARRAHRSSWYRQHGRRSTSTRRSATRRGARTRRSTAAASGLPNVVFARDLTVRDMSLRQELRFRPSGRATCSRRASRSHRLDTGVAWDIAGDRNPSEANGSSVRGGHRACPSVLDSSRDHVRGGG